MKIASLTAPVLPRLFVCSWFGLVPAAAWAGEDDREAVQQATGQIESVTVYRQQALVSRNVNVPAGKGLRTIRVIGIPDSLIPDSMFAEGEAGTAVRAVRVTSQVIAESNREEVRNLERESETIQGRIGEKNQQIEVIDQQSVSLDRAFDFGITKASDDLNRGSLDVDSLIKMTQYSDQRRDDLSSRRLAYQNELEDLQTKLTANKRKLERLAASGTRTLYEAIVFVDTDQNGPGAFKLCYRVGNCGWTPQYTFAGGRDGAEFRMRYGALVTQSSGEDWNGVELVLSTASASANASGPILTPLRVTTEPSDEASSGSQDSLGRFPDTHSETLKNQLQSLRQQQRTAESWGLLGAGSDQLANRDIALNSFAAKMQRLELLARSDSARSLAIDAADEVSTQNYIIDPLVSLSSRRDQQLVQIADTRLTGRMYHVVTPLLSSYAYREAELKNTTSIGLMSGPAMVYLDGRFVGQTEVPPTASGQRLIIGFGADQQIRTRRELVAKRDDIQGGNRRLHFTYRLVVSNFKNTPVNVRVLDRLPDANQSQSVALELEPPALPLCDDGLYVRMRRPNGILRWDVTVPAGRHGSDAFDIDYSFTAAFDRSRQLTTDSVAAVQADYRLEQFGGMGGGMGGSFGGATGN